MRTAKILRSPSATLEQAPAKRRATPVRKIATARRVRNVWSRNASRKLPLAQSIAIVLRGISAKTPTAPATATPLTTAAMATLASTRSAQRTEVLSARPMLTAKMPASPSAPTTSALPAPAAPEKRSTAHATPRSLQVVKT
ncbi:hypothetical protein KKH43_02220 [Patescibacteria group bacterium]|nr:hypothetical protein [Patescibacteria group bacterium]